MQSVQTHPTAIASPTRHEGFQVTLTELKLDWPSIFWFITAPVDHPLHSFQCHPTCTEPYTPRSIGDWSTQVIEALGWFAVSLYNRFYFLWKSLFAHALIHGQFTHPVACLESLKQQLWWLAEFQGTKHRSNGKSGICHKLYSIDTRVSQNLFNLPTLIGNLTRHHAQSSKCVTQPRTRAARLNGCSLPDSK